MTTLIIDVRTPYQLLIIKKMIVSDALNAYTDLFFIAPSKLEKNFSSDILGEKLFYDVSPTEYVLFPTYLRHAIALRKQISSRKIDMLTAVNHGPFFLALRLVQRGKIILFEDGISTYLKLKKRFSLTAEKKFLYSKNYDYAILEENSQKFVPKPLQEKVKYFNTLKNEQPAGDKRNYFVSSSSVEYGLETIDDYKQRVGKLGELLCYSHLYISFHHNETRWREKLEIFKTHFKSLKIVEGSIALETVLQEAEIGTLVAPYNTTAMNVVRHFGCERILLFNDAGPNMAARIEFFKKTKTLLPIYHISEKIYSKKERLKKKEQVHTSLNIL